MRSRILFLPLAPVIALLALPGLADAQPRPLAPSPSEEACPVSHIVFNVAYYCNVEFSVAAGNGYRIAVSGEVGTNRNAPDDVTLSASRGDVSVNYLGHGKLTSSQMTASFGRFGRFSVRFRPSGKVRRVTVPKACVKDRPPVVMARLGTYVGTIRFEGEGGYTKVLAHRADGGIGDPLAIKPKLECERGSVAAQIREAQTIRLSANAKTPEGGIDFGAWAGPALPINSGPSTVPGDPYTFLAVAIQRAGGVSIVRSVAATAPAADFVFDSTLDAATVAPPVPFSGSATFQRNADGTIGWTGSLAVSFPGMPDVPLVGPRFEESLGKGKAVGPAL
jgi:hypothetical protein